MAKVEKRLLLPARRRSIPSSGFSWIDRRFVADGFLAGLTGPEALLYFFLVAVADHQGLSFFGDRRTAALLKLTEAGVEAARRGLERKDLIRYRPPLYQVLSLPDQPGLSGIAHLSLPRTAPSAPPNGDEPRSLASLLQQLIDP